MQTLPQDQQAFAIARAWALETCDRPQFYCPSVDVEMYVEALTTLEFEDLNDPFGDRDAEDGFARGDDPLLEEDSRALPSGHAILRLAFRNPDSRVVLSSPFLGVLLRWAMHLRGGSE